MRTPTYGAYVRREEIEREHPEIMAEWDAWLDAQMDPGNYDAYKDKTKHPPEWVCDTYLPPHMMVKIGMEK